MERNRRPPDVEEALSSMLWTPYQRTSSESSEDDQSPIKTHKTIGPGGVAGNAGNGSAGGGATAAQYNNTFSNLYSTTDKHLYPEPIRYTNFVSNYSRFFPKSYNNRNQQLPSYENIEKERQYHSLTGCPPPTGIYFVPQYPMAQRYPTMVHSFTDDFVHYQVSQ